MKRSAIEISGEVLLNYPETAIGYVVAGNLHYVADSAKTSALLGELAGVNLPASIDLQNLVEVPQVAQWRKVYEQSGVKPKTFKSSVESLLRRLVKNEYRPIIPIVDLYNFVSANFFLSAGGYDWGKLTGTLTLRYGLPGDKFLPLSGRDEIAVAPAHIVYADEHADDNIVCWMWNHKDSRRTMLSSETDMGLFLFDALQAGERPALEKALQTLNAHLIDLGADIKTTGILDHSTPFLVL